MADVEAPTEKPKLRAAAAPREFGRIHLLGLGRARPMPSAASIARRRFAVRWAKLILPFFGLALLASVALWPDFETGVAGQRVSFHLDTTAPGGGGKLLDARYSSVDDKGEPYTVTADSALQMGPDRVDLSAPKGDITLHSGSWVMLSALRGVYAQKSRQLDLSGGVTLYRDDGTTLRSASATVDLAAGAAASGVPVSAEGPFGTLDAMGFTLLDGGSVIQFSGPARLVLNGQQNQ
ncbi:MAG TPA: LPS export ABC transporter periplasmic protein LptC [Acetobacteraceae bacterium]|nr:LPS export ABC transporter periplasmic protein LptC [Acetobacteraceae bacterium]